jgi:hypothetical protein
VAWGAGSAAAGTSANRSANAFQIVNVILRQALRVTLPWHNKDRKRGTLRSIVEQAGFTLSEFIDQL